MTIDERALNQHDGARERAQANRFFGNDLPLDLEPRRAGKIYFARLLTVVGAGGVVIGLSALGALTDFALVLAVWVVLLVAVATWALWRDMARGITDRASRWRARFLFPSMFGLFTVTAVTAASLAVVTTQQRSQNLLIAVCVVALISDFLLGKLTLIRAEVASEKIVEQSLQGVALTRTAQPLISALGDVVAASSAEERRRSVDVLVRLSVGIAQTVCGRNPGRNVATRAIFYELVSDDRVVRRAYEGSYGGEEPRASFDAASPGERRMVDLAKGDQVLMVNDLDLTPAMHFPDFQGPYKSYITIPVRAGDKAFGILVIDSDTPDSLTDVDIGYAILLAGILGSGLAAADATRPTVGINDPEIDLLDDVASKYDVVFAQELPRTAASFSLQPETDREILRSFRQHEGAHDEDALEQYTRALNDLAAKRAARGLRRMNTLSAFLVWAENTDSAFGVPVPEGAAARRA